ncbi:MAG: hypothetical protein DWQ56_25395 [Microcystis aeruginosa DA14]|uniref:Uncharacterized protein n=1 Tax=Microcystis aeruginosa DA14 TaxID=1987506 RepID=A0A3E0LU24_MICAE|nr:MAG: hypothetical protein DWQ56_25395 [Microcystis aeruginosa DA14]
MTYNFSDLGYAVQLSNGETDILLQGEDAEIFLNEVDTLKELWENGSPTLEVFPSYEKHLEVLIDPYF